MLTRLDRIVYQKSVGVREHRRALAFAIFLKDRTGCSVVKDWSYRKLSSITGLSPTTCQKRVRTLREMNLLRESAINGHRYMRVLALRSARVADRNGKLWVRKNGDIIIGKIDRTSVKSIGQGLMAMLITETQKRKDAVRQLADLASGATRSKPGVRRRARKVCRERGWNGFYDDGFSYEGIAKRLGCSLKTVSIIIAYGERVRMFKAKRGSVVPLKGAGEIREGFCPDPDGMGDQFVQSKVFACHGKLFLATTTHFACIDE